jgi:hypothetical protein
MYKELIFVACSSEGCAEELGKEFRGKFRAEDVERRTVNGTLLFSNHSSALRAGQRSGWLMMDKGAGGDVCPDCQKRENPVQCGRCGLTKGDEPSVSGEPLRCNDCRILDARELKSKQDREEELATEEERLRCEYEAQTGETEERYSDNPESDRADEEFAERVADKRRRPKQHLRLGEHAELKDVRKVWGDQGIGISSEYKQGRYHWRVVAGHIHGRGFDQMSELEYTTEQKALDAAYNYGRERCGS